MADESNAPLIVGIDGTTVAGSSTERALVMALEAARAAGLRTYLFGGEALATLPLYVPCLSVRTRGEHGLVTSIGEASGVIIASPGYHGGVWGLVKNAIDQMEETARDPRPYLDNLPVGLIATAYGWQATGSTIAGLRAIVHALRGPPTSFAAAVKSAVCRFDADGGGSEAAVGRQVADAVLRDARRAAA